MLEKAIERRFVKELERRGAMALKFVSPGRQGVPDRIVLLPGGQIVFVELKAQIGRISPIQRHTIARMQELGCDVRIVFGMEQTMELVDELCPPTQTGGDAE